MFIQGFYNAVSDAMVQDTVTVYLRNSSSPYDAVDSAKAYLNSSGSDTISFINAVNSVPYYIQLKHRNSIETWSNGAQIFTGSSLIYNFTTSTSQAFGNNAIQVDTSPVRFAIYSGDANQDGLVDLNDVISVYNAATAFATGYIQHDMNGDNIADLNDVLITYNNSNAFVSKILP
ncbi:MAG: hypothetical protein IPL53_21070 [Ignavibacteria bacterium]|nr:hypothetical protein [Ignavibacteria bacterium]